MAFTLVLWFIPWFLHLDAVVVIVIGKDALSSPVFCQLSIPPI